MNAPEIPSAEGPYPPTEEMLATPVPEDVQQAQRRNLRAAWDPPRGWRMWSEVNNTQVGLWYTLTALAFMLLAGLMALLIRLQLAVPENDLLGADLFNQLFTLHGSAMMFLFAVPIFEALAILLLPAMLGARDMPFPRLSAYGFWCFLIGGVFVMGSILFQSAPRAGWFMYPPLATEDEGPGSDIWLLGLSFIEIASLAAAVELIVGTLKCRPPGMRVNLMPLYAWYVMVVGGMILFAFPPLIAGDLLFEMQRSFDWPFFDPARGGDPMLWQHLFWIFGHPEVYIVFLPSIAIAAMIVPTASQQPIVGYSWIVLSAVGTGFISFGLWVHHMFTTGLPSLSLGFFSAASVAVVIPTGIQFFAFIATMMVGRLRPMLPLLWIAGALAIFTAGGLTGVMVAMAPFDFQAHDTYFIVAHLHYTLFGGMVLPVIAGAYYFMPFITKKHLSERLGRLAFWLIFIGFNVTFLPMHLTGLLGMPRRVYSYPSGLGWDGLNLVSTLGAALIALGFAVFVWDLATHWRRRDDPARNPWNAGTLEWCHELPIKYWGVRSIPHVTSRYPLWDQPQLVARMDAGRFYLPDAPDGRRETIVTSVIDAAPLLVQRVTGPSWLPLVAALFTGGAFILPTFKLWVPAALSAVVAVACIMTWLWRDTARPPPDEMRDIGLGLRLPTYASGPTSVGWWAVWITMLGDATGYASVVFGYFFYWTARPDFPPEGADHPQATAVALAAAGFAAAWALTLAARSLNHGDRPGAARAVLVAAAALGAAAAAALAWSVLGLAPASHAYPAILCAIAIWICAHAIVGLLMQLYCLAGSLAGKLTPRHDADLWNVSLYWHFHLLEALVGCALLGLGPMVIS